MTGFRASDLSVVKVAAVVLEATKGVQSAAQRFREKSEAPLDKFDQAIGGHDNALVASDAVGQA